MRKSALEEPPSESAAAAKQICDGALSIGLDDKPLIFFDETSAELSNAIIQHCLDNDIVTTAIFLPTSLQKNLSEKMLVVRETDFIPTPISEATLSSTMIISLLSGDSATSILRKSIINLTRAASAKFANVPGASPEVVKLIARSDFKSIDKDCELLGWVIGCAREGQLTTFGPDDQAHRLNFELGGWENEPMISSGTIRPGSWGNVPPGEVFCCPDPKGVHGKVFINGSVPGERIVHGGGYLLTFEHGRLVHVSDAKGNENPPFFQSLQNGAASNADTGWNVFAELGIGLNPAVTCLTGNPLFDEKAAHTIHVAIGDNTVFGKGNAADIHIDMVTAAPTLLVDGILVIDRGEPQLQALSEMRRSWVPPKADLLSSNSIRVKEGTLVFDGQSCFRRLSHGRRISQVRIAEAEIGRAMAEITQLIVNSNTFQVETLLSDYPVIGGVAAKTLLDYLSFYECLLIRADSN